MIINSPTSHDRIHRYKKGMIRYQRLDQKIDQVSAKIAFVRFVSFVIATVCTFSAWYDRAWSTYSPWAVLTWIIFLSALWYHRKIYRIAPRVKMAIEAYRSALVRIEQRWSEIPDDGMQFCSAQRPHEQEMLLFGDMSAYKAINRTHLQGSKTRLAFLLKGGLLYAKSLVSLPKRSSDSLSTLDNNISDSEDTLTMSDRIKHMTDRQKATYSLSKRTTLRLQLEIETRLATQKGGDLSSFVAWSQALGKEDGIFTMWYALYLVSPFLVLATCIQGILTVAFGIPTLWQVCLLLQLLIFMVTTATLQSHYAPLIQQGHSALAGLSQAFKVIEQSTFQDPYLQDMQNSWYRADQKPSQRIAHINRIADALAVRHSALLYGILAIVFLWEVRYGVQAWRWRSTHGVLVHDDLDTLYDWEAMASLAAYADDHSEYTWADLHQDEEKAVLYTEQMAHPLFPQASRKANDFTLQKKGHLWLITGSNMSGKSSFLRTLGLNAHLAFAGAPVCANSLTLTPLRIASSVQITDDPSQGWSRFYAEVKRIRSVIEAAESAPKDIPILFLIDEMLSGTNSKERRLASRRIAQRLLEAQHAFGLITTHDLDLAHLIERYPQHMFAAHFSDYFDGKALHFDYQLKDGVAQTTNALHVLQLEGIYVAEDDD
jgi:hypothetical protein